MQVSVAYFVFLPVSSVPMFLYVHRHCSVLSQLVQVYNKDAFQFAPSPTHFISYNLS